MRTLRGARQYQRLSPPSVTAQRVAFPVPQACYPSFAYVGGGTALGADATTIGSFTMGNEPSGTYYLVASIAQRDSFDSSLSGAASVASHPGCTTVANWGESASFGLFQPGHVSLLKPNLASTTAPITMTPPPFVDFVSSAGIQYDYVISVVRVTDAADYLGVFFPADGWDNWIGLYGESGGRELWDSNTTTSQADAAPSVSWAEHGVCLWVHSRCGASPSLPTTFTSAVDLDGDLDANQQAQAVLAGPYPSYLDGSFTAARECEPVDAADADPFTAGFTATTNINGRIKLLTSLGAVVKGRQ